MTPHDPRALTIGVFTQQETRAIVLEFQQEGRRFEVVLSTLLAYRLMNALKGAVHKLGKEKKVNHG